MVKERFNEHRVCIDKLIKDGYTKLFDCEFKAIEYARRINSYYYPVFTNALKTTGEYAVPK